MATIPKVSIRFSDSYKAAIDEITRTIEGFKSMDDLYDTYMVESLIRTACLTEEGEDLFAEDYDFGLDLESLYINISHLPTLLACKPPVLSMLEYAFKDSPMKLWVYINQDDQLFMFVQLPLSYIAENARHY